MDQISKAVAALIEACGRDEQRRPDAGKWLVEPDLPENVAHARDWLAQTEPAVLRSGSHAHTYQTAAMLRDRGISEDMALELMLEVWNPRCIPPWPPEKLAVVVGNPYRYAKRPAGCEAWSRKAQAIQAAASEPNTPATQEPKRRPYKLSTPEEIELRKPPEWLVDKVFPMTGLGEILGATGTYKSFLALDLCLHVAYGLDWMGRPTKQRTVVYVAGEGSFGLLGRIKAWLIHHRTEANPKNFYIVENMPPFMDPNQISEFLAEVIAVKPGLVIFDTLARAMPGLDENSAKDMAVVTGAADRMRQTLGAFIIYVHHTGKDEKKGSRGSSAGPAALDIQMTVTSDPSVREAYLKMTKGKDVDAWAESHTFKGHRIDLTGQGTGLENSLAFAHAGVRDPRSDDKSTRAASAARFNAARDLITGRGINEALTNRSLAEMIAEATTAEDDWPEEGPVREDLVSSAMEFLSRTVAKSEEGRRWLANPDAAPRNRRWRDPDVVPK